MPLIETKELTHVYLAGTSYEKKALDRVSLSIEQGELFGIVGANGCGKSTLIQHFNGLLVPTSGSVIVCGKDTTLKQHRHELWKEVGLVFQFPEQQLFESSIFDEIAFGLKNLGLEHHEITHRVEEALLKVNLNPQEIAHKPPQCLSSGTRRQVALACILAMRPSILVLDEPTAGLDSSGCKHIINAIEQMRREYHTTVVLVSHQVNELILLAGRLAFLEQGRLISSGNKREVFRHLLLRNQDELVLPDHIKLMHRLAGSGVPVNTGILTLEEAISEIDRILKEKYQ